MKHAASMGLRHARMNISAGLSYTCTIPSLLSRVKAGGILGPDPATVHCGQRCDRASLAETHACMLILTRKR